MSVKMSENAKYRALQAGYWMLFCAGYGYVTFTLLAGGYAAGEIGIVTAVFGTLAALLQPVLGRLADKGVCGGWRGLLMLLAGATAAVAAVLLFCRQKPLLGILYGLLLMLTSSMMPLVNAASFHYKNSGITIDFGVARGLGSLAYAAISLVLGWLTVALGVAPVLLAAMASAGLILLVAAVMPYTKTEPATQSGPQSGPNGAATARQGGFLRRYPRFCLMLAGGVLLLSFHNITNTYLLQMLEAVGGDSSALGIAMAIAALMELPVMFGFTALHKHFTAGVLLVVSGVAFAAKGVVFLLAGSVAAIYAAQVLQMLSFAMYASASVYYAEESMAPADKVSGQALASTTITVGAVLGNLLGGWVLELGGVHAMLLLALAFAMLGAVLAVLAVAGCRACK